MSTHNFLLLLVTLYLPPTIALAPPIIKDKLFVTKQLGYLPPNYREVSAWTLDGSSPVAIKTYPLHGGAPRRQAKAEKGTPISLGAPFPTLYWLTCPDISRAISDLERRGYVSAMEDNLNSHSESSARFLACHEHYAQERWTFLSQEDRSSLEVDDASVQRMRDMLQLSGVAGTNHTAQLQPDGTFVASVKCLHAHYAHYRSKLVDDDEPGFNPVGFWVHQLLVDEFPDTNL